MQSVHKSVVSGPQRSFVQSGKFDLLGFLLRFEFISFCVIYDLLNFVYFIVWVVSHLT